MRAGRPGPLPADARDADGAGRAARGPAGDGARQRACACRWSPSSTPPAPGLSQAAEEGAMAGEIARCIAGLVTMEVPTVSVILGQGCGGGALAMLPADTVLATERGWLSPLPPEGASVIVHGDASRAAEMAERQRVGALDLLADGDVHGVVPEDEGDTPETLARAVVAEVAARLAASRRPCPRPTRTPACW
ncbi:carboxyl transferase domain-containing protein [Nocardioides convexus]|uniref:carboxyl transferase domain-containing protein n=1 Tax=Nocardioides convexus TaxID=2712224 RepID=UPI0024184F36|nr:carboxyl transferase domain-containing protein [Nocardioides convexus]